MTIQVVGVIGAGVMGIGVAQALAEAGYQVIMIDISEAILDHARASIRQNVRLAQFFRKGVAREPDEVVLERISCTTDYQALHAVDFLVENAVEKWEVKRPIYEQIDSICTPECIFAANTSAISITRLAGVTQRPDRVVGMHFMNPVPLKPMVEVIRGVHTSPATIAAAEQLVASMGKASIVVNDAPGFVTNRAMMLMVNEAIFMLQDQVASADEIDRLFRFCFGHTMGPLETADLIGLDTVLLSIEVLYDSFNDSKYRPCPLLKKMVDAGLYGRKSGRGFYSYAAT